MVKVRALVESLTGRSLDGLRDSLDADEFPRVGVGESVVYCEDACVCPERKALA